MTTIAFLGIAFGYLALALAIFRLVDRDYERHARLTPWTSSLQFLIFASHAAVFYLALIDTRWPRLPSSRGQLGAGLLLGLLGLGVLLAGFGVFRSVARVFGRRADELKQSGIYRWTRNPQLVGYGVFLVAWVVVWPSWPMVISLLVYGPVAHRMALVEEAHLRRQHGQEYVDYCARTARYVPIPRKH